jgi:two-component system phosphate regulon sensor histidine kinase PhoR
MTNVEDDMRTPHDNRSTLAGLPQQRAILALHHFYKLLDLDQLCAALVRLVVQETGYTRALLLMLDTEDETLSVASTYERDRGQNNAMRGSRILWTPAQDVIQRRWMTGEMLLIKREERPDENTLHWLLVALATESCFSIPLISDNQFLGVLLAYEQRAAVSDDDEAFLSLLSAGMAGALDNAQRYSNIMRESTARLQQLTILNQIDRELNDNIQLPHVFDMTLDWAMRYTNAQAASLALYDELTGELQTVADLGYALPHKTLETVRQEAGQTTAHRVARAGRTDVVPDVAQDKDYIALSASIRSQLIAPITREDRVIAVITIESKKLNAFTEDHVAFVEKLSARAGVAIDNARLFSETARARAKLERILQKTADVVIVIDESGALEMMNTSALAAFGLDTSASYGGQAFEDIFTQDALIRLYAQAIDAGEATIGEVQLPSDRTFYANIAPCPHVGWIIVMHDITPLKRTDRLKNELIAAVSHDLKQPLGIMHGFAELLMINAGSNEHVQSIVPHIQRAINNMKQLIDDQLDLARLESGVQLHLERIYIRPMITDCIENLTTAAQAKNLHVEYLSGDSVISLYADRHYLYRILINIIGNAIKYTPNGGYVHIYSEDVGANIRITVEDNGLGITPEDQAQVFDRFYRVRRPENEGIDGTGLGLAIVKRLVELHHGQINLVSELGKGTTFAITLPMDVTMSLSG